MFPKETDTDALPRCLRLLNEEEYDFLPVIHDRYVQYFGLAESLKEAVHSFLINNVSILKFSKNKQSIIGSTSLKD